MASEAAQKRAFLILLGVLTAANTAVLAARLLAFVRTGGLIQAQGESISLYGFWKLRHGYPLYESLTERFFAFTPYNFLFYESYAALMNAFGVRDDAMAVAARFATLAFAVLGTALQIGTARLIAGAGGAGDKAAIAGIASAAWLGCGVATWSTVAIRPDMAAAALVMLGLYFSVAQHHRPATGYGLASGAAFAAAWCFKQSFVSVFVAVVLHRAIVMRSPRSVAAIGLPWAAIVGATLWRASPSHLFDILTAPTFAAIHPYDVQFWTRGVVFPGLLFWIVPLRMLVAARHGVNRPTFDRSEVSSNDVTLLGFATAGSLAWALLTAGKVGATNHYFVEPAILAALLTTALLLLRGDTAVARGRWLLAAVATVPMIGYACGLLISSDRLTAIVSLRARSERLRLDTDRFEFERRAALAALMQRLPPPVYIDDEALSVPWIANRNQYPAVLPDPVAYHDAVARGLVNGGIPQLFRDRYFGSALVVPRSAAHKAVIEAGYVTKETVVGPNSPLIVTMR